MPKIAVKEQFAHRAYVYSVLKRLKDKDQIIERRGRYFFRVTPKLAEAKDQAIIHQKRSAMASLGGKAKH